MRYIKFLILFNVFFSFSSCEKEAEVKPKDYPYVITISPNVNEEGAEFLADLTNLGRQEILKYGFVWSEESNPKIQDYYKLFEDKPEKGIYKWEINSGLSKGQTYYVRAYILTDQCEVYGNVKSFKSLGSLPPFINNFTPTYGPIGTQVIIEGVNFALSKTGNIVKFGDTEVIIDSVSENMLIVTIPEITKPEKVTISIETAEMITVSEDSFDLWFPWKRLKDFYDGYVYYEPICFSLNNKGYFGLGNMNTTFWEYDPKEDTYTRKADLPKSIDETPMSFTANNRGYVLFLDDTYAWHASNINELWEYNPIIDSWIRKADFPGFKRLHGVALNINEKGYIVTGENWNNKKDYIVTDEYLDFAGIMNYPKDFWEYDPFEDKWTQKADFPGSGRARSFGFSINGFGYVGIGSSGWSQNSIYKYNPEYDTWEYVTDYPGNGYNFINGFIINNKCYLGLGSNNSNDTYSDFWEFNVKDRTWKKMRSYPIDMAAFVSFSVGNKGYYGIGWIDFQDFSKVLYEFDPSKN